MYDKELRRELEGLAADLERSGRAGAVELSVPWSVISPDEPILSRKDDRLNRAGFAKELATAIIKFDRPESIVVGIYGKWGTGKTSLLNLIEEQLQVVSMQPPLIFRFNPWGFSEQEQLLYRFFEELSAFLRLHHTIPKLAEIAGTVEEYGQTFAPISEWFLPRTTKAVRAGWSLFRRLKPLQKRTAPELKAQIDLALKAAKSRLIVMVDDIDRLNVVEIRQVFQLIKLNANFNNTVFIVAFDDERIASALKDIAPEPSSEYLEKIVQVAFTLPPVAESTLTAIILANVDETIASLSIQNLDTQRFGNMFHSGFRQSFHTPRDVNRYFNLLRFAGKLVGEDTNFIDLAGMQALALFYRPVYSAIQGNPELFAGTSSREVAEKNILKTEYDAIFGRIPADQRKHAYALAEFLFPKMRSASDSFRLTHDSSYEKFWRQNKLVASKKYFPYYFHLAIPDTEVSQAELDRALIATESLESFASELRRFKDSSKFESFITRLRDSLANLNQQQLLVVLTSVFAFGDEVDTRRSTGTFGIISDHVQFASWLLFDVIDLLQGNRFIKVKDAMHFGKSPFTVVNVTTMCEQMLSPKDESGGREKYPDLTSEIVDEMKQAALEVIHNAAKDNSLARAPELPRILLAWMRWEDATKPKDWIAHTFLNDPTQAVDLISRFLNPVSQFGFNDKVPAISWELSFKLLSEFADVVVLSKLIQDVTDDKLFGQQLIAKNKFEIAMKKFEQGINPDNWQ